MSTKRLQWIAAVVAVSILLGSAGTVWARTIAQWDQPTTRPVLCDEYQAFAGAVIGHGPAADAGLRMTAARLQHSATGYASAQYPDSPAAGDAAAALQLLLNAPYASRKDLFVAARPIAIVCGLDWRNGSQWEFAPGS